MIFLENKIRKTWEKRIKSNGDFFDNMYPRKRKLFEETTFTRVLKNPRFKTLTFIIGETENLFVELHCTEHYHYFCTIEKNKINKKSNELTNVCKIPLSQANYKSIKPEHPLYKEINNFIDEVKECIEYINN